MKINTCGLLGALKALQPVARMRSTDGGGRLRISANGNNLHLTCAAAGELVGYMEEWIPFPAVVDPVGVRFDYLLNALDSDAIPAEESDLEFKAGEVVVISGGLETILKLADATAFPAIPKTAMTAIGVQATDLLDGINAVHGFEASDSTAEYILSGLSICGEPKLLTCQASLRNAAAKFERLVMCPEFSVLVPGKMVDLLLSGLQREGATLQISDKFVGVAHSAGWIRMPLIAEKFLNMAPIWSPPVTWLGTLDREALKAELTRTAIYLDPNKAPRVELKLGPDGVHCSADGADSSVKRTTPGSMQPASIFASCPALLKCLTQMRDATVEVGVVTQAIGASASSIRFRSISKEVEITSSLMR